MIKPNIFRKLQEFFEILIGFAGETDNDRCPEHGIGHMFADSIKEPLQVAAGIAPPHAFQQARADVLNRHIEV